jgi:hypothetical protein
MAMPLTVPTVNTRPMNSSAPTSALTISQVPQTVARYCAGM